MVSSARTTSISVAILTDLVVGLLAVARRSLLIRHRTARQKLRPHQRRRWPMDKEICETLGDVGMVAMAPCTCLDIRVLGSSIRRNFGWCIVFLLSK